MRNSKEKGNKALSRTNIGASSFSSANTQGHVIIGFVRGTRRGGEGGDQADLLVRVREKYVPKVAVFGDKTMMGNDDDRYTLVTKEDPLTARTHAAILSSH